MHYLLNQLPRQEEAGRGLRPRSCRLALRLLSCLGAYLPAFLLLQYIVIFYCSGSALLIFITMDEKSKEKEKDNHHDASKLERLLSSHSLEGLVYQKRQRKQTANLFPLHSVQAHHAVIKKKNEKLREKKFVEIQKKESKIMEKQVKKASIKKQSECIQKEEKKNETKKRGRPRKVRNQKKQQVFKNKKTKSKNSDKNDDEQNKEPEQNSDDKGKGNNGKDMSEQNVKQSQEQQSIEAEESQVQQKLMPKKKQPQKSSNQQQNIIKQPQGPLKLGFKKFTKTESTQQKQKQQQPKKDNSSQKAEQPPVHKITRVHSVTELKQSLNRGHMNNSNSDQDGSNQVRESGQRAQQQEEEEIQDEEKVPTRRRLRNKRNYVSFQQPDEELDESDQPNNSQPRKRRLRKTKNEAMKKFTLLQAASQQDQADNYQIKKKKTGQKQYQINRIFRKTQKPSLPNTKLQVDLSMFPFHTLSQKFPQGFDMIHCSLPLEMLIKLPQITSLITKGFIFIWVEKHQISIGYHWLNRMGFDVIDQIVWVKTNEGVNQVVCDRDAVGEIFPNCKSTCLVGYKCSANQKTEYCTKISNNLIFESQLLPLQKPDQIYQMGDLMMPGARKLQIGYKEVGGWFTLKHREQGLARCHQCLAKDTRRLWMDHQKRVLCGGCLEIEARLRMHEERDNIEEGKQEIQGQVQPIQLKIDFASLYHLSFTLQKFEQTAQQQSKCHTCKKRFTEFLISNQEKYCRNCYTLPTESQIQLQVLKIQQTYFASKAIQCSKCETSLMKSYYFQCFTCKDDHNMCSACMRMVAKEPYKPDNPSTNHEWKLKILHEFPQQKALCFTCHEECQIPYWGCQTCQNWYWCGTCKNQPSNQSQNQNQNHQHHCHYNENRKHHLQLII